MKDLNKPGERETWFKTQKHRLEQKIHIREKNLKFRNKILKFFIDGIFS